MAEIIEFLKICETANFRHQDELMTELKSGKAIFNSDIPADVRLLPASHYLAIYQRRAKHLQKYSTAHAASLKEDVLALCKELEKTPQSLVQIWSFSKPPYFDYSVFVDTANNHILGCILGIDARLIDESTRIELWGNQGFI